MNFCLLYAAIWTVELILYSFRWSDLNRPLNTGILVLILSTILLSLVWGYRYRELFRFKYITDDNVKYKSKSLVLIACIYLLEFVVCRQVPFISILLGRNEYTSYSGIPIVHILIVTYACYYSFYSYYIYEASGNKKYLLNTIIIAFLHLMVFSRVSLMVLIFEIVIVKIGKRGGLTKVLNPKRITALVILIVIVLFGFGVLGNIRCGSQWNDSTIISTIGQYNDKYPDFLPDQFKWAYTYVTSPLANMNNGITAHGTNLDIGYYFASYVPDFISRRLFPNYLKIIPDTRIIPDLNAVSGYYNFYYFGSLIGALAMYFVLVRGTILALRRLHFSQGQYYAFLMISAELVFFLFFYDVIYLSQCSFCLVYPLISVLFRRIKIRI